MELKSVMFFSGSVLHEKEWNGSERVPLSSVEDDQEQLRLRVAYRAILERYRYTDYVKCVQRYLSDFIGSRPAWYLMNSGTKVVAHGRHAFKLYRPGSLPDRATEDEIDRGGQALGAFARTASIAAPDVSDRYGFPQKVRFMKEVGTSTYDLVPVPTDYQEAKNQKPPEGWEWATYDAGGIVKTTSAGVGNASSRVMTPEFDAFIGKLLDANIGFPVFSVCDCNSFHTSGYLWSAYAARSVMAKGADDAFAILNFDQHTDLGEGEPIGSDKWGKLALKNVKNGCYMSFGNSAAKDMGRYAWSTTLYMRKDDKTTNTVGQVGNGTPWGELSSEKKLKYLAALLVKTRSEWTPYLANLAHGGTELQIPNGPTLGALDLGALFTELWTNMVAELGRPFSYVFITVDRDVIQGHQTQWGDASFFEDARGLERTIQIVTDALLTVCPACKFVGFDITGLPESRAVYRQRDDVLADVDPSWAKVADEIERLHALAVRYTVRSYGPSSSYWLIDTARTIFDELMEAFEHGSLRGVLAQEVKSAIRTLHAKLHGDSVTSLAPDLKLKGLVKEIWGPLVDVATQLDAASAKERFMHDQPRAEIRGFVARIRAAVNALTPGELLEDVTGGPGTPHGPRAKGFFKGKKTVTFSLTGGGRRY